MEIMNKTLTLLFVLLGLMVQVLGHMKTVLILVLGFTVFNVRNHYTLFYCSILYYTYHTTIVVLLSYNKYLFTSIYSMLLIPYSIYVLLFH